MRSILAALAFGIATIPALALAADKPPELTPIIKAQQPVGQASLRKLLMHIYDAQFWSDSGDWKKPPYALTITYDMGFTANELAERTYDEMQHVAPVPADTLKAYADKLRSIYPPVSDGDRITALQKNKEVTAFYHNGKPIGEVHDAAFGPAFFAIWLSPKSSESEMQKKLLPTPSSAEGI